MKPIIKIKLYSKFILNGFFIGLCLNSYSQFTKQTEILLPGIFGGSVSWIDYNKDGLLDVCLTGCSDTSAIFRIYKNNSNNSFTEQTYLNIKYLDNSSICWSDFNNDDFPDFLLSGMTYKYGTDTSILYLNNGDGTFSEKQNSGICTTCRGYISCSDFNNDGLSEILQGSLLYKNLLHGNFVKDNRNKFLIAGNVSAWGDLNNDGFLDLIMATRKYHSDETKLYKNNGDGTFTEAWGFDEIDVRSISLGDYNNDSFLDVLFTGQQNETNQLVSKVYKNNGNGTFTEMNFNLPGVSGGNAIWGDFNNDGLLDILLSGAVSMYNGITKLYQNNGNDSFTELLDFGSSQGQSTLAWGDYNNDGLLDFIVSRYTSSDHFITQVYKNTGQFTANTKPSVPANIKDSVCGSSVILSWDKSFDDLTPQNGLSYNVQIYSQNNEKVYSSVSDPSTGFLFSPGKSNQIQTNSGYKVNLQAGTYRWKVQAIDNEYAGGNWSAERTFTISSIQASNLSVTDRQFTSLGIQWTKGNGTKHIVFMAEGNKQVEFPINNMQYIANNMFSLGDQLNTSGWYCVYNDTSNHVTVSNLKESTDYSIVIMESTENSGNILYNTTIVSNVILFTTRYLFEELTTASFPGIKYGSEAFGDYNNDGLLDIALAGYDSKKDEYIAKLYKNNGDNTFSEQSNVPFTGMAMGCVKWADYNNDGNLDLMLTGYNETDGINSYTKLYSNNGDGSFTELNNLNLLSLTHSSVSFGDYNKDGFSDILICGNHDGKHFSKIYRNSGDSTFSEETKTVLVGLENGSCSFGDYDNDGLSDILICGANDTFLHLTQVYKNNGDGSFTEQTNISLTGVAHGKALWADFNNDGYLDILISGSTKTQYPALPVCKIYINQNDGDFAELNNTQFLGLEGSSMAVGDYNNDGFLDFAEMGYQDFVGYVTKVYRNNGDGTFSEQNGIPLMQLGEGSIEMADFDNDGLLDIFSSGWDNEQAFTTIYKNFGLLVNTRPIAPTNLDQTVTYINETSKLKSAFADTYKENTVTLKWDLTTDSQTSAAGLSYNVRVGTSEENSDIISSLSLINNGKRLVPSLGNAGLNTTTYTLKNLSAGTYYWSVQAIDNAFEGSAWGATKSFTIGPETNIAKEKGEKLKIYPNPCYDYTNIESSDFMEISVIDINGKTLIKIEKPEGFSTIDMKGLSPGVYFLESKTKGSKIKHKLIVLK